MMTTETNSYHNQAKGILVVDDHANISKLVEAYVSKAAVKNIIVDYADSLEIACLKVVDAPPKLVMLDNLLPPYFDFRHSLKELKKVYDGPIVLFSGEIPRNIGEQEIDKELAGVLSKDEIAGMKFVEILSEFLG